MSEEQDISCTSGKEYGTENGSKKATVRLTPQEHDHVQNQSDQRNCCHKQCDYICHG